jgi:sterol desaturase/sphingolipid hydroxylase (fatty acid hydroxylase superfamily)
MSPTSAQQQDAATTRPDQQGIAVALRIAARRFLPFLFIFGFPGLGVAAVVGGSKVGLLAVYLGVEGTILLAERFIPFVKQPPSLGWRKRRTDLIYLVSSPVVFFIIQEAILPAMQNTRSFFLGDGHLWFTFLPLPVQIAITLVGVDFTYYWAHRLSHAKNIFWRSHRVHHSAEGIDWLMNWRVHWLNELMHLAARFIPLVLLGVPVQVVAITMVIVNAHSMFPHANADVDSGPLNLLFNTAELHRWHHLREIRLAQSNFCATTVIWDHVFGTYRPPAITPDALFGVPADELEQVPESWSRQLLAPLRRDRPLNVEAGAS